LGAKTINHIPFLISWGGQTKIDYNVSANGEVALRIVAELALVERAFEA
jgi:hypothetical protein